MYDYREASTLLKKQELTVRVERIYSETFEVGSVVRTEPEAATLVKKGDTVIIYASQGPAVGTVVVPEFLDHNEVQTLRKVLAAGLQVGTVTYQQSNKPAGTVLAQDVPAFKVVHANTKINFIVSGGPDYMSEPFPDDPFNDDPFSGDPFDTTPPVDPDDPYANWEPDEGFSDPTPGQTTPETEKPYTWLDHMLNRN